jgi:nucleotidyltransferase DUF2204
MPEPTFDELIDAMKAAVGALQGGGIPLVLGGGLAAWARGGPKSEHDVDLLVRPVDADRALAVLEDAGMRTVRPPEGWLYKAWHENGTMIDVIFEPADGPIEDELIERSPVLDVMGLRIRVSPLEDLISTKLLVLSEQEPSFEGVLELARALREQVDWHVVRVRTAGAPFALAFFTLLEELGIVDSDQLRAPAPSVLRADTRVAGPASVSSS